VHLLSLISPRASFILFQNRSVWLKSSFGQDQAKYKIVVLVLSNSPRTIGCATFVRIIRSTFTSRVSSSHGLSKTGDTF
jgi:hypothetical protein